MKVKELILRLQECNPEAMVVVDGYEGGLEELKNVHDSILIALDVNAGRYGPHEPDWREHTGHATVAAVYLPR